jgi:hypothetical protein
MSEYLEKLKDPRWQKLRLRVFEREGFKCQCCDNDKETLHVHHLIYSKGEPWEAPIETLECLCESCHEFREDFNRLGQRSTIPTRFCHAFVRFSCFQYPRVESKIPDGPAEAFCRLWRFAYKKDPEEFISKTKPVITEERLPTVNPVPASA